MATYKPVKIDPKQLKTAEALWDNFVEWSKRSIIGIVAILCLLALIFV